MKILHTADWHLGKLIHGIYMTEDQSYLLDALKDYLIANKPDLIIIAGDIFDRAIPPVEAIALLDRFLNDVVLALKIPMIAISGNHDSPQRLKFGSNFLTEQNCHLITHLDPEFTPITMQDEYGDVHIYPIPYCEPALVREVLKNPEIKSHDEVFSAIMAIINSKIDKNARNVLILHAFVIHSSNPETLTSDSERPLAIGGSEFISADHFECFDYVALGHLHQSHAIKNERIQYSGSLLKYSLSEANHKKCLLEVTLGEKKNAESTIGIKKITLTPKRDMREVKGALKEILAMPKSEDYIFVTLLDETPVLQPMEQVRTVFPNTMHVRRDLQKKQSLREDHAKLQALKKTDDLSLFQGFYEALTERTADEDTLEIFMDTLNSHPKAEQ